MLENREYWQQPAESPWQTVTVRLLLLNGAVFVIQSLLDFHAKGFYDNQFMPALALNPSLLFSGYLWQLLTFQFLHANFWHILFNSIAIYFVGKELEHLLGKARYLALYLVSGALGGLCQALLGALIPNYFGGPVVGASAGAYGLIAAYATLCPEQVFTILLWFIIPVRIRVKYLLVICLGWSIFGIAVPGNRMDRNDNLAVPRTNYAHAAHLGGMLFGIAFIKFGLKEMEFNWSAFRRKLKRPELVATSAGRQKTNWRASKAIDDDDLPGADFISKEVDPILDKISAKGIHSLTKHERAILEAARKKIDKR